MASFQANLTITSLPFDDIELGDFDKSPEEAEQNEEPVNLNDSIDEMFSKTDDKFVLQYREKVAKNEGVEHTEHIININFKSLHDFENGMKQFVGEIALLVIK